MTFAKLYRLLPDWFLICALSVSLVPEICQWFKMQENILSRLLSFLLKLFFFISCSRYRYFEIVAPVPPTLCVLIMPGENFPTIVLYKVSANPSCLLLSQINLNNLSKASYIQRFKAWSPGYLSIKISEHIKMRFTSSSHMLTNLYRIPNFVMWICRVSAFVTIIHIIILIPHGSNIF